MLLLAWFSVSRSPYSSIRDILASGILSRCPKIRDGVFYKLGDTDILFSESIFFKTFHSKIADLQSPMFQL